MLLAIGFSRATPWFMKLAIDTLRDGQPLSAVMKYVGAMVATALAGGLFLYFQRWLIIGASRRIEYELRTDLFAHVQSLDLEFFDRNRTGDLMARFTNDLNSVRDVVGPGIMYSVQMTTMLVASITLMLVISPFLTLVAFLPFPLISLITYFFGKRMYVYSRQVQDLFGVISSRAQEDLAGVRVIRAYTQEANSARKFHGLSEDYLEANMRVARLRAKFMSGIGGLAGVGLVIALLVGGRQVVAGTLTLGELVAFSAYLADLIWPVIAVGWVMSILQRGASAMSRLQTVIQAKATILSGPDTSTPAPRIAFENVAYRYVSAASNAVEGISFAIEPGQTLGIVGRTGSGKSTVLRLLLRFYDPTEGRILLDGVDLRERSLEEVRKLIGYAPQDSFLFSRTLSDNLAYGLPGATDDAIRSASAQAHFQRDVDGFPRGYETLVGERGVTLSGGQRQRASLARALLLDPRVLVLDDTLSAVDAETEEEILGQLRAYVEDRTAIIVSHRISAVEHADHILVLDEGRILEEGRHEELLRNGKLYARLHERQKLAREIERTA